MKLLLQWGIFAFWIERCLSAYSVITYPAMAERFPFFTKVGKWESVSAPVDSPRPDLSLASTTEGGFMMSFRGYGFSLTISRPAGSSISVWVNGKRSTTPFIPENESAIAIDSNMNTGLPNMFTLDVKTEVDDHYQLVVDITASEDDPVILDRIQIFTNDLTPDEWSDAASLSGLWTLIDDNDELVTYSKLDWQQAQQPLFVNGTVSVTNTPGAWVQLTFTGSGIWVLGAISVEGTVFSVEVVKKYGREVTRNITTHNVTRPGLDIPLYLTKLFVETDLPYANAYSYNFTLISGTMMIDFIGVDGVPVPAGAGDVWSVAMPLPTSNNLNLRIVIPAVLCALVVAVLVGFASLFLCKRYLSRRRHRLGLATDMLEKRKEETVQPFRAISTPSSNACESRTTKGSLLQIRYANSQHHHSSSSNTTTISLDDSLDSTHPISSAQGQSDSAYSESQGPSIRLPPGDYGTEDGEPLSLSHADLAKVFRRAEKLRQSDDGGESDALEPHLETLARQLANRGQ